jgi:hypothetical protein
MVCIFTMRPSMPPEGWSKSVKEPWLAFATLDTIYSRETLVNTDLLSIAGPSGHRSACCRRNHRHNSKKMGPRGSDSISQGVGRATMIPWYRIAESSTRYSRWWAP